MEDILKRAYLLTKLYIDADGYTFKPKYEDTLIEVYCEVCEISNYLHNYVSKLWLTHTNLWSESERIVEVNNALSKVDKLKLHLEKF